MLKIIVGYGKGIINAKERAIELYEKVEGRKTFHFAETQWGIDTNNEQAWVTTIWYTILPPVVEKKEEPKHEFIGSTDIDPNDPNWREKWEQTTETFANIADH